ncbi:hypothetical protein EVAR_71718_1 [Eumeta japonica]|uniref:Uncharacterized protein n=1 Tax=Eumeta variegata TaxID=151549 RepID=A0A4C1TRR6_EUMVA|nr:hypothetical protein EVAR_71718_1 [Eumeta japonica]
MSTRLNILARSNLRASLVPAAAVHCTRNAPDTPAEHIVGEPLRDRSRIGTQRFNLQNPIALLLNKLRGSTKALVTTLCTFFSVSAFLGKNGFETL